MARGLFLAGALGTLACVAGCPASPKDKLRPQLTEPVKFTAKDLAGVVPSADYSDLAAVLKECVRSRDYVEPAALKRVARELDAQVKRMAVAGPTTTPRLFPTADDRLAYWYNARIAWALLLGLRNDCPDRIETPALETCPFPLDGRQMTLGGIDEILAADTDWRAAVAAPGVRVDRASPPTEPFSGKDVRTRVARRLNSFIEDGSRFVIDHEKRTVFIPRILWPLRQRLIDAYERDYHTVDATLITALLRYVQGVALYRLQDAIGLPCVEAKPTDKVVFPS